jgi:hypothetical protein
MGTGDQAAGVLDVAVAVGEAIESVGGSYFVGGSLASSLQGEPRATNDIDIVVALPIGGVPALVRTLGADFEVDTDMLRDALLHGRSCNIFHLPSVTKVDLFAVGPSPYDETEFARRQRVPVGSGGRSLVVKTAEDTVLRKLLWHREGGLVSERQWRDVVGVLRFSGGRMDQQYVASWAVRLGIGDLLERARGEAGSTPNS